MVITKRLLVKTEYWNKTGVWRSETIIDGKYYCGEGKTAKEAEDNLESLVPKGRI